MAFSFVQGGSNRSACRDAQRGGSTASGTHASIQSVLSQSAGAALTEILQTNLVPYRQWKFSSQTSGGWGVGIMALPVPCLGGTHFLTEGHLLTMTSQPPRLKGRAGSLCSVRDLIPMLRVLLTWPNHPRKGPTSLAASHWGLVSNVSFRGWGDKCSACSS